MLCSPPLESSRSTSKHIVGLRYCLTTSTEQMQLVELVVVIVRRKHFETAPLVLTHLDESDPPVCGPDSL